MILDKLFKRSFKPYVCTCRKCSRDFASKNRIRRICDSCKRVRSFSIMRLIALKRDENTCKKCLIGKKELRKIKRKLNVHHINCNRKDNRLENLITLCDFDHRRLHARFTHSELKRTKINISLRTMDILRKSMPVYVKPNRFLFSGI